MHEITTVSPAEPTPLPPTLLNIQQTYVPDEQAPHPPPAASGALLAVPITAEGVRV